MLRLLSVLSNALLKASILCALQVILVKAAPILPTQATVNLPCEFRLVSSRVYARPLLDVRIRAVFTHRPSGKSETVSGFWAGDSLYGIRFAPTLQGVWEYRITSNDAGNQGLNGITGTFLASTATAQALSTHPQASPNPLIAQGFLRVAESRRTLEYADGAPFFWLGDTAWEIFTRGTKEEIIRFLDDRARKGFTVLQTTHAVLVEDDTRNRNGTLLYLDNDRTRINPRFFDEFDSVVTWANARGMVVALVPQWAHGGIEGYERGWVRKPITLAEALIAAEYIGARYAAHHLVWVTGGDVRYDTPEKRAYWERFGNILSEADGGRHLVSIHPEGYTASYDFFSNTASWLDFNMLQSSHQPWDNPRTEMIRRGYAMQPAKPILNAEPPYEDFILNSFFSDIEAALIGGKRRATPHDIRVAAYMSIFHGGLVGITYGANAIFQWNSATRTNESFSPRFTVDSALSMPGAAQMGLMKRILTDAKWQNMIPRLDLVTALTLDGNASVVFHGAIASNERLLVYVAEKLRGITLSCGALRGEGDFEVEWISPTSGEAVSRKVPFSQNPISLQAPLAPAAERDWLVSVRRSRSATSNTMPAQPVGDTTQLRLTRIRQDMTSYVVEMTFAAPEVGTLDVQVYDVLGNFLLNQRLQVIRGEVYFVLPIPASGAYFYRAVFENEQTRSSLTGKFTHLR